MIDLIDRQAAIDAFMTATADGDKAEWCEYVIKQVPSAQPDIIQCKDCIFYDPPHVENKGKRFEYQDMPSDAFDELGTGFVTCEYGINVGGRCCRDYTANYSEDKRIFVPETNYCGRAERIEVEYE